MLFLAAIDKLTREELIEHVANLEALHWARVAREITEKKGKQIHSGIHNGVESAARWFADFTRSGVGTEGKVKQQLKNVAKVADGFADRVDEGRQKLTWEPYEVSKEILKNREALMEISDDELRDRLLKNISRLANHKIQGQIDPKALAEDSLETAAGIFKDKITIKFTPAQDVENAIFKCYVERLLDNIKEKLQSAEDDEVEELERKLRYQLEKLSSGDADTLKKALNLQELTASNVVNLLKKGTITAGMLIAVDATGFGAFLFLTTFIKSISLLLGITFSFTTYTAATAALGFLLGPIGGSLLVGSLVVISAGIMSKRFNGELLAGEIFALHCKLLEVEKS